MPNMTIYWIDAMKVVLSACNGRDSETTFMQAD